MRSQHTPYSLVEILTKIRDLAADAIKKAKQGNNASVEILAIETLVDVALAKNTAAQILKLGETIHHEDKS